MAGADRSGVKTNKRFCKQQIMNELNLDRLNLTSPYTLWRTENNSYGFRTNYGVIYRVGFYKNELIWADNSYEFGINNENHKTSPNDNKVKGTILAIIEEFIISNPSVLLYQCETGDNRQAMRARLFAKWFNDYKEKDNFVIKAAVVKDEDIDNYIGIIIQRNNPQIEKYLNDFENFVRFFTQKPI